MTLIKYRTPASPASPVDRLASELFGQSIDRFFGNDGFADHAPRVNIVERPDDFKLEVLAPGFDKKDLKVNMVNDSLTISGEHTVENQDEDERYTRREFNRSSFERSFVIPKSVKADAIQAEYMNGVLKVIIPKTEESKPQERNISIN